MGAICEQQLLGIHDSKGYDVVFFLVFGNCYIREYDRKMQKLILMWLGVHGLLAINGMLHAGGGLEAGLEMKMTLDGDERGNSRCIFSCIKGQRQRSQSSCTWFCWAYLCCRR